MARRFAFTWWWGMAAVLAPAVVQAQGVGGIAGYLLVGRSAVAAMPAASSVVRGLWIVTDASTTSTCATGGGANVVVCVDQGSTWAALTGSGGGAATDVTCTDCVALGSETTGPYAGSSSEGGAATTATALAANGANCSAGNYPLGVDASGAVETCTADDDAPDADGEVPDALTLAGATIGTSDLTLKQSTTPTPTAEGRVEWDTDDDRVAVGDGAATKLLYPGPHAGASTDGGAATTATALAADPADCSANQFATTIGASGALTCAAIADADVPNTITVDLAAAATALATNAANCSAGSWSAGVDASGAAEGCTADDDQPDSDAEVPDTITASNYAPLAGATFTGQVVLPAGSVGTPSFLIGSSGAGLYQRGGSTVTWSLGGDDLVEFRSGGFCGVTGGAAGCLKDLVPSATVPTLTPDGIFDSDTGIGTAGANLLSLIAGGVEGIRVTTTSSIFSGYLALTEIAAPAAPATNGARLFVQDNGSGKTQICALFATGAAQCFATEP